MASDYGAPAQSSRRETRRTTKPADSNAPPPATSSTTSSPVNGSVLAVLALVESVGPDDPLVLLLTVEQSVSYC
jgi:hypothetical protein